MQMTFSVSEDDGIVYVPVEQEHYEALVESNITLSNVIDIVQGQYKIGERMIYIRDLLGAMGLTQWAERQDRIKAQEKENGNEANLIEEFKD